ncbi:hypothetical protein CANMA_000415 [Candida margitis]|uniref:uncharacterized protein n=1 Tax=Candida margitis TaxID=1775924 RepID=UPI002226048E|nr:uncharacterized protein CANMA_000415 [Candida margitis]KAI5970506.1 hypothetical protein CANMA_000415 [Candida margitis]
MTTTNQWATYPSIAKTASINGFADSIYDLVPSCAQDCLKESTGSTPCPYWDAGCLCVMPQFAGAIGDCVAQNCQGSQVVSFESLATSICSSAGVWEPYFMVPASVSTALSTAAAANAETTPASTAEEETTSSTAAETSAPETTAPETSTQGESSAPAQTSAPETTSVQASSAAASQGEQQQSSAESSSSVPAEGGSSAGSSASASVLTANGAVIPGVAMGGVIAALAALI